MKNKNLEDIRPARGVKMGQRAQAPVPHKPQVIKNVQPPSESVPPPTEEAAKIVIENKRAKDRLIEAMKGVNRLMNRQVLPENKSVKENDEEHAAIAELVNAAVAMEELSAGEGLLGMATLAVRQGLSLRDAGNRLAYDLEQTRKELQALKSQVAQQGKTNG